MMDAVVLSHKNETYLGAPKDNKTEILYIKYFPGIIEARNTLSDICYIIITMYKYFRVHNETMATRNVSLMETPESYMVILSFSCDGTGVLL